MSDILAVLEQVVACADSTKPAAQRTTDWERAIRAARDLYEREKARLSAQEICPDCNGSGEGVADTTCSRCNGSGGTIPYPAERLSVQGDEVERVAIAICESDGFKWDSLAENDRTQHSALQDVYRRRARAALTARSVPVGGEAIAVQQPAVLDAIDQQFGDQDGSVRRDRAALAARSTPASVEATTDKPLQDEYLVGMMCKGACGESNCPKCGDTPDPAKVRSNG